MGHEMKLSGKLEFTWPCSLNGWSIQCRSSFYFNLQNRSFFEKLVPIYHFIMSHHCCYPIKNKYMVEFKRLHHILLSQKCTALLISEMATKGLNYLNYLLQTTLPRLKCNNMLFKANLCRLETTKATSWLFYLFLFL